MPEIFPESYPLAKPLFASLEKSHALVAALFNGDLSARVLVDDTIAPRAGVIVYNSRVLCGGNATNADFIEALAGWFNSELIHAHKAAGNDAYLFCFDGEKWKVALEKAFCDYQVYHGERQYYEISNFSEEKDLKLPAGFSMHLITPEFLSSGITGLEQIREEMRSERISEEDFLARSFGLIPVYENEVAGWCMSEYNVGDRCEIGIATAEKHQRKGIASLSTRFFLSEARRRGYTRVGWDCWARNIASAAAARKAGLSLVEAYPALVVVFGEES